MLLFPLVFLQIHVNTRDFKITDNPLAFCFLPLQPQEWRSQTSISLQKRTQKQRGGSSPSSSSSSCRLVVQVPHGLVVESKHFPRGQFKAAAEENITQFVLLEFRIHSVPGLWS